MSSNVVIRVNYIDYGDGDHYGRPGLRVAVWLQGQSPLCMGLRLGPMGCTPALSVMPSAIAVCGLWRFVSDEPVPFIFNVSDVSFAGVTKDSMANSRSLILQVSLYNDCEPTNRIQSTRPLANSSLANIGQNNRCYTVLIITA